MKFGGLVSAVTRLIAWVRGLSRRGSRQTQEEVAIVEVAPPVVSEAPVAVNAEPESESPIKAKPRNAGKRPPEDKETLAYLLDNLDLSFKALSIASEPGFDLSPSSRAGLKRIGPFIPPKSWARDDVGDCYQIANSEGARYSSLIFIALNEGHRSEKDILRPDFFYAVQEKSQPLGVQKLPGRGYQCGFAWRSLQRKGRLVWCSFYCAIDEGTGLVTAANHVNRERIDLPKGSSYTRSVSVAPFVGTRAGDGKPERPIDPAAEFVHYFNLWERRSSAWSVSARRGGRRVTFGIEPNAAVSFFRDRGREAVTPSGQRKPILHAVSEHVRANGSLVRAHIRGAEKFQWNNFDCSITAPDYHVFDPVSFGVPAKSTEELENYRGNVVSMQGLARVLSDLEDNNIKKGQRKRKQKELRRRFDSLVAEVSQPIAVELERSRIEEQQEIKELLQSIAKGDSSLVDPGTGPVTVKSAEGDVFRLTAKGSVEKITLTGKKQTA